MSTKIAITNGIFAGASLSLISEANGTTVFRQRQEAMELTLTLRQSVEKPTKGSLQSFDRSTVEFKQREFPRVDLPGGRETIVYMVVRSDPNSNGFNAVHVALGLMGFMSQDVLESMVAGEAIPFVTTGNTGGNTPPPLDGDGGLNV